MHLLVGGPALAWKMFPAWQDQRNLELFEMRSCHWTGAGIWLRHKRKKLVTASLLLHCSDRFGWFRYCNELFKDLFQILDGNFLLLLFDGNVCNWIPKMIWPWMDWSWVFCSKMASFVDFIASRTEIGSICWIVIFLMTSIFSMFSLRCILVCCLKTILIFSHRILPDRLKSPRHAIQFYFLSFCVYQLFFREVW